MTTLLTWLVAGLAAEAVIWLIASFIMKLAAKKAQEEVKQQKYSKMHSDANNRAQFNAAGTAIATICLLVACVF